MASQVTCHCPSVFLCRRFSTRLWVSVSPALVSHSFANSTQHINSVALPSVSANMISCVLALFSCPIQNTNHACTTRPNRPPNEIYRKEIKLLLIVMTQNWSTSSMKTSSVIIITIVGAREVCRCGRDLTLAVCAPTFGFSMVFERLSRS